MHFSFFLSRFQVNLPFLLLCPIKRRLRSWPYVFLRTFHLLTHLCALWLSLHTALSFSPSLTHSPTHQLNSPSNFPTSSLMLCLVPLITAFFWTFYVLWNLFINSMSPQNRTVCNVQRNCKVPHYPHATGEQNLRGLRKDFQPIHFGDCMTVYYCALLAPRPIISGRLCGEMDWKLGLSLRSLSLR